METLNDRADNRVPWNKGKRIGQKPPLKLPEIWAIRTRLRMSSNIRELAMFNLAIDSKLRANFGQTSGMRSDATAGARHTTLCPSRSSVGRLYWTRRCRLRHACDVRSEKDDALFVVTGHARHIVDLLNGRMHH